MPELVQIKDLGTNTIIKEWNGTSETSLLIGCPIIESNPATSGATWSTKSEEENPIILNHTG